MFINLNKSAYAVLSGSVLLTILSPSLNRDVYGQETQHSPIPRNATVFIDSMNGFGPELQKALASNGLPLVIVSDKASADFEITGEIRSATEATDKTDANRASQQLVDAQRLSTPLLRLKIVNLRNMDLAWGYGTTGFLDLPSAADACAKQLKKEMKRSH